MRFCVMHIKLCRNNSNHDDFIHLEEVSPVSDGFTIIGMITNLTKSTHEATISDSTATAIISLTEKQYNLIKSGDCIVLQQGKIKMVNINKEEPSSHVMRIHTKSRKNIQIVDHDWDENKLNKSNNVCDVEYELIET